MVPYKYKGLDANAKEIRLLTLVPKSMSDEIHVVINKAKFDPQNVPVYEALSYVWGDPKSPTDIKVGFEGETLSVTQNLATALSYLRLDNRPRVLWVDAMCIDQENIEERGHQVGIMGDIYRNAGKVVVWLGPEQNDSNYALEILRSLSSKVEIDTLNGILKPSLLGESEPDWANVAKPLPFKEREWMAIYHLFTRPWFDRLWVQQEVRLAGSNATVTCGTASMLWSDFGVAYRCLYRKPVDWSHHLGDEWMSFQPRLAGMDRFFTSSSFMATLRSSTDSKCSDPRDRVYALLSLLSEDQSGINLRADYTLTTGEVYRNVVIQYLECFRSLSILTCCEMSSEPNTIPTWVPDWRKPLGTTRLLFTLADTTVPAAATYMGNGVLRAAGVYAATIQTMKQCELGELFYDDILDMIRNVSPSKVLETPYVGGGSLLEAFCETLCANTFTENLARPLAYYPKREISIDFLRSLLSEERGPRPAKRTINNAHYLFCNKVAEICENRCFFTTKDGYMGLAPKTILPGDEVFVLLGCETPLVLRKSAINQYQVVGECYINGFMSGEALFGTIPHNYKVIYQRNEATGAWTFGWLNLRTDELQQMDPRVRKLSGRHSVQLECTAGAVMQEMTPVMLKNWGVNVVDCDLV